jgi:KR domain
MPSPIKRVVQAAMVLQDSIFGKMTYEQWLAATRPKIQATSNLNKLLANENMDFFIMRSSIVSILGNCGQAAYAAANSYLDARGRYCASEGLPARTINVGVVRDAGFVSENAKVAASLEVQGFASMDMAIAHPTAFTADLSQLCVGLGVSPATMKDPKLKAWTELHGGLATKHEQVGGQWFVRGLQDASSPAEASTVACSAIAQQLAKRPAMASENWTRIGRRVTMGLSRFSLFSLGIRCAWS